jgi:hypothetical protein
MSSDSDHVAACACGRLRVAALGEPEFVVACHCIACQRRTGSPFGVGAYYPRDRIGSVEGEVKTFTRTADSGRKLTNHFCPNCGTPVYWTLEMRPNHMGIALGCFTEPHFARPSRTIWTEHQHDWISLPDDLPAYERAVPTV